MTTKSKERRVILNWPLILTSIMTFLCINFLLESFFGSDAYLRYIRMAPNSGIEITEANWSDDSVEIYGRVHRDNCVLASAQDPSHPGYIGFTYDPLGRRRSTVVDVPPADLYFDKPLNKTSPFGPFIVEVEKDTTAVSVWAVYDCWWLKPNVRTMFLKANK